MIKIKKKVELLQILNKIDSLIIQLDAVDRNDGYGDLVKNFESPDGIRITKRLKELITEDL